MAPFRKVNGTESCQRGLRNDDNTLSADLESPFLWARFKRPVGIIWARGLGEIMAGRGSHGMLLRAGNNLRRRPATGGHVTQLAEIADPGTRHGVDIGGTRSRRRPLIRIVRMADDRITQRSSARGQLGIVAIRSVRSVR